MRRVLIALVAICSLSASVWTDPTEKSYLPVDDPLLARCRQHMTSGCFADIAWALARDESKDVNLGGLAERFARLQQWDRAYALLARIPAKDNGFFQMGRTEVAGERLALELAAGNTASLNATLEETTLDRAATRLLGYLLTPDRSGRLNRGLWFTRIKADRAMELALLRHWAGLPRNEKSFYSRLHLAEAFVLVGEESRAREMALAITPNPSYPSRPLIDLLLLLGEQERALEVAKFEGARHRSLFMSLVATSFAQDRHDADRATDVALEAAEAALLQSELNTLEDLVGLLNQLGKGDEAQHLAIRAEKEAQRLNTFKPHRLSKAGAIYGAAGDNADCLRLQAEAVEATENGPMGFGFVARSVGYGKGRFDLLPELMEITALRRFECGDNAALNEANIHQLSRNYCSLHGRGLLGPDDILGRPDSVPVLADAAECHFMRGEPDRARLLLRQLETEAQANRNHSNRFRRAYEAADVACVYSSPDHCQKNLHLAGRVLIERVAARKMPAGTVIDFAVAWQFRVGS